MSIGSGELQPLLSSTAPTSLLPPVLRRALLALTGKQLLVVIFILFLANLLREHHFKQWFQLVGHVFDTDVLYALGTLVSFLACSFWISNVFAGSGFSLGSRFCFLGAAVAAGTVVWCCLLKLTLAHHLNTVCLAIDDGESDHGPCDEQPKLLGQNGFLVVWLWMPAGLFRVVASTLLRPWGCLLDLLHGHGEHTFWPERWWQWRELTCGFTFWIVAATLCTQAPALARSRLLAEETRACSVAYVALFCIAANALIPYAAFLLLSDPLLQLWQFILAPWGDIFGWLSSRVDQSGADPDLSEPAEATVLVLPECIAVLFFSLWFIIRFIFLLVNEKLEQCAARQKCEEGLQRALANPFRADLEQGFATAAAMAAASEAVLTTVPGLPTSTASDLESAPLQGLLLKRERLIEARRFSLCEEAGGEAALPPLLCLHLQRSHLLNDTCSSMVERPISELLAPNILVDFDGEEGIDIGGLTRDWFDTVARELVRTATEGTDGLLEAAPDGTLLPSAAACTGEDGQDQELKTDRLRHLLAVGRFLALAVLSARPLPLTFSLVVCKYLLRCPVGADDVRRLDPEFFRGRVETILQESGVAQVEAALGARLFFTSAPTERQPEPQELVPGGASHAVTEENKLEYIQLLCEAYLCGGIRSEIQCLLQGFWDLLPLPIMQQLEVTPVELSMLVSGIGDLDPLEWQENSKCSPEDSKVCDWFWEVVANEFGSEQRCLLLHFVTGSSRLPLGGFAKLNPPFNIEVVNNWSADHLPHAHTCINQLILHTYTSKDQLLQKLLFAISVEGFALN